MRLIGEAKRLLGEQLGEWGSGWYNIKTGQDLRVPETPHVDILLGNQDLFGLNIDMGFINDPRVDEKTRDARLESLRNRMDGQYDDFYAMGWMRYLWAQEGSDSLLGVSGTDRLLSDAWSQGVIQHLLSDFQATYSYVSDQRGKTTDFELPAPGEPSESMQDYFFDTDEISDIRRLAGMR